MNRQEAIRQNEQENTLRALGFTSDEAAALRRISMTLRAWYTLECGNGNEHGSWAIERDPETEVPYMIYHRYNHGAGKDTVTSTRIPDRETGAVKRLDRIMTARNARFGWQCEDRNYLCDDGTVDIMTADGEARAHNVPPATAVVHYYLQTDPRGASLYIIRPGDIQAGDDVSAYYTRGLCVY